MIFSTEKIRNIAITGHGGTGKTTLVEHLLFTGGAIAKPELVDSGRTVSDYTDEEIEKKISIHASLTHIVQNDTKINIIDTPGSSDFVGDMVVGLRACETVALLIDGKSGVQIESIKVWRQLQDRNKPRFIFVNKLDEERASFEHAVDDVHEKFKVTPVAITIPMGEGPNYKGVIDVLNQKAYFVPAGHDKKETAQDIPVEYKDKVEAARAALSEAAADGDDELMEKYLSEGVLSQEEILKGLCEAFAENRTVPAFAGSAVKNSGVLPLILFIEAIAPSPLHCIPEKALKNDNSEAEVKVNPDAPFAGFIVKTQIDQFSGKLSFVKVFQGTLTPETEYLVVDEGKKEKANKLFILQGKKLEEVPSLAAGDIGILAKSQILKTNYSISDPANPLKFLPLKLPQPVHAVAISAASKKDEDKLSELLHRFAEEDLTFTIKYNAETKETVISGMGEQQINMILDKVKHIQKMDIQTRLPRVAYRETITKKAGGEYTHKKQTGGHGQYGKVVLEVEPLERGQYYAFENKVFGGAISKNFVPGIEKGIHQAMERGVVAGYPVVDVKTNLLDGKEHPVDSSEMAFKIAARGAFREATKNASPVLLEPIMNLTVFVEEKYLGDVMSDLSGRRGRISGQQPIGGGIIEIKAQVPQAELLRYSIELRSMTSGTGAFEVEFDHYAPITGKIAEEVIKAAEAFREAEKEEEE